MSFQQQMQDQSMENGRNRETIPLRRMDSNSVAVERQRLRQIFDQV